MPIAFCAPTQSMGARGCRGARGNTPYPFRSFGATFLSKRKVEKRVPEHHVEALRNESPADEINKPNDGWAVGLIPLPIGMENKKSRMHTAHGLQKEALSDPAKTIGTVNGSLTEHRCQKNTTQSINNPFSQ